MLSCNTVISLGAYSPSLTLLPTLVLIFILYQLATTIYFRFQPGLRELPGPSFAAWTNWWRLYNVWAGQAHRTAIDLHRTHGELVRIGPRVVSVADPSMIPKIYNTRGSFVKTAFYPIQSITWNKRVRLNVFSVRDEKQHREMKRKLASAYTLDSLLKMEEEIDECGDLLIKNLREQAEKGNEIDLGLWLHYYAFDVIGTVTFNERFGFLESGSDVEGLIAGAPFMQTYIACVGQIPILHKFLLGNPALPYVLPQVETANWAAMFSFKALQRRTKVKTNGQVVLKDEASFQKDMLSQWARSEGHGSGNMTLIDTMVALTTNIFAGSDTTTTSLRAVLYHLLKNPTKMQRTVREIDAAYQEFGVHDPITDRETRDYLPYVQAAIKEAMRLSPAPGLFLERHVPPGGAEICGKWVPSGTIVGINPWVVHRDPEIFPDPDEFFPERWLSEVTSKAHLAKMEQSFFAFGAGSRLCLGRNLSMVELRKIIPRLLWEFEIHLQGNFNRAEYSAFLVMQKLPNCTIKRRVGSPKYSV